MKAAMWATFIVIGGIAGIVLINIFGNITTTNQQDYTLLKNTVEASMYDSIDIAAWRNGGFYVCSSKAVFDKASDYDITYVDMTNKDYKCTYLTGEVMIKKEVFVESFLRRYSENINNNKSYKITVQEVVEYPPKVSIRIDTYDTYNGANSTVAEFKEGDFSLRNQVDAILENVATK